MRTHHSTKEQRVAWLRIRKSLWELEPATIASHMQIAGLYSKHTAPSDIAPAVRTLLAIAQTPPGDPRQTDLEEFIKGGTNAEA